MNKPTIYHSLSELLQNRIFHHFSELCKIPHPSFAEKQVSDYLLQWAKDLELTAWQDEHWNVFIKKPASPGYENAPCVMLQAHTDMVCEKALGVEHNFATDPIFLQLDGDVLSTGGRTTLGADDGIGVALAMAILEDKSAVHPPLEVLFTTAEEEDLSGAQNLDASTLQSKLMINIDNAVEHELLVGSCGGMGVEFILPLQRAPAPPQHKAFELAISGLPGGHSGEDIRNGHGNAIQLLGRLLFALHRELPCSLATAEGGNFRLAIPREARATVMLPAESEQGLHTLASKIREELYNEYRTVAPELAITVSPVACIDSVLSPTSFLLLLQAITLMPCGICEMDNAIAGVVSSSDNLGELHLEADRAVLICEIRAAHESTRSYLYQKMEQLAALLGATCRGFSDYPGWAFNPISRLRPLAQEVYRREFKEEICAVTVHAGLECGCLYAKIPQLDIISIGPDTWGLHSPSERLSVASTQRIYHYLEVLLREVKALT